MQPDLEPPSVLTSLTEKTGKQRESEQHYILRSSGKSHAPTRRRRLLSPGHKSQKDSPTEKATHAMLHRIGLPMSQYKPDTFPV